MNKKVEYTIELLSTIGTLYGMWLLAEHNDNGFWVNGIANMGWLYWGWIKRSYGIMIVEIVLTLIAIKGIMGI
jgi:hypothetical protein